MTTNYTFARTSRLLKSLCLMFTIGFWLVSSAFAANGEQPCAGSVQTRQLDYWLGNWTMGSGADKSTSTVSLSLDKCVFVERWENGKGHVAEMTFAYSPEEKNWYGMFVDNEGRVHVFLDGKVISNVAEFHGPSRGPNGESVLNKLKIIHASPDRLEEVWEKSTDKGSTWTTAYRAQYSRENR
jgi:hypothetical protein